MSQQQHRSGVAHRQRERARQKHGICADNEPVRCIACQKGVGRVAAARPWAALSGREHVGVTCASALLRAEFDHVKVWQTVGKLRRRHGLVLTGEPRQLGYVVNDWTWEARRARSSVKRG